LLLLSTSSARGFPRLIPTWTIAEQYGRARLVVVARAGKSVDIPDALRYEPNTRTPFTIVRTLKGPAEVPERIFVESFTSGGCPAGPSYHDSQVYLLYL